MNSLWKDLPDHLRDNPFFHYSKKSNYVPAWDKIKPEHVLPAFDFICERMRKQVDDIAKNPALPSFKNTVEAIENAYSLPMYFFVTLFTTMPRDEAEQKQYDEMEDILSDKFYDLYMDMFQNKDLLSRFVLLSIKPEIINLTGERAKLYGMYANTFRVAGALKSPAKQQEMRELGKQISRLGSRSQKNMREAEKNTFLTVTDADRLKGLPDVLIASAAAEAEKRGLAGQWCFGIGVGTYEPFMKAVHDRDLRREMWELNYNAGISGPYDNRQTILDLVKLEHKQARMEGHRNPAVNTLHYNMASDVKTVEKFLRQVRKSAKPVAEKEVQVLRDFAKQEDGIRNLEPWDLRYYEERLKKKVLGFDEEDIRPYLELESTVAGTLRHFEKFFGIKFKESKKYPKYNEDLRTYNVTDARTGKHMGVLCMDLFDRKGKPSGTAWNISAFSQGQFEGENRRTVDMVVTKFVKGQNGQPTLMTHYDLLCLMHEMGHATHNLMSKCRYQSFSGTSVDTDFVEFPSQFHENWAFMPEVLDDIARHHKTGEKIPDDVKERIKESAKFMAGQKVLAYARKGWLDQAWYRKDTARINSVEEFELEVTKDFNIAGMKTPLTSPRFHHIFGGGYDAAFYSYQWSQIMGDQMFEKFEKQGLYDRSLRAKFKKAVEVGGSQEETITFHKLAGTYPRLHPFLRQNGLTAKTAFDYSEAFRVPANDGAAPRRRRSASHKPEFA
ncbi:MAG: M3 family metallopeptidase [Micavibrio sp.]